MSPLNSPDSRPLLTVDLGAVADNTRLIVSRAGGAVMAVVKADGFGHGAAALALEGAALKMYDALGCGGVARVNFFLTPYTELLDASVNDALGTRDLARGARSAWFHCKVRAR